MREGWCFLWVCLADFSLLVPFLRLASVFLTSLPPSLRPRPEMLGSETGWLARVSLVPGICWLLLHDAFPPWPLLPPLTQHLVAWQLITKLEESCYERPALPLQRPNNSSSWVSRLAQLPHGETVPSVSWVSWISISMLSQLLYVMGPLSWPQVSPRLSGLKCSRIKALWPQVSYLEDMPRDHGANNYYTLITTLQ